MKDEVSKINAWMVACISEFQKLTGDKIRKLHSK